MIRQDDDVSVGAGEEPSVDVSLGDGDGNGDGSADVVSVGDGDGESDAGGGGGALDESDGDGVPESELDGLVDCDGDPLGDVDGLVDGDVLGDGVGVGDGECDGLGDGVVVGPGIAGTGRVAAKNADHQTGAIFTFWPVIGASIILPLPIYMPTCVICRQSVLLVVEKNTRSPGSSWSTPMTVVPCSWSRAMRGSVTPADRYAAQTRPEQSKL